MSYQWFNPGIDLNDSALLNQYTDVFLDCTKGIVDQMITLWEFVNLSLLPGKKKKDISPDYIREVSDKLLPKSTKHLLEHLDDPISGGERNRLNKEAEQKLLEEIRNAQSAKKTQQLQRQHCE